MNLPKHEQKKSTVQTSSFVTDLLDKLIHGLCSLINEKAFFGLEMGLLVPIDLKHGFEDLKLSRNRDDLVFRKRKGIIDVAGIQMLFDRCLGISVVRD